MRRVAIFIGLAIPLVLITGCTKTEESNPMSTRQEFPTVDGVYQLTDDWSVTLPGKFKKRIEDGNLVLWRPGFTIWTVAWNNDKNETPEERLAGISKNSSPEAYDKETETEKEIVRYSYRLAEAANDKRQPAFYCFAIGKNGHVQMAIYFESADQLDSAKSIWRSLVEHPTMN